MVAFNINFQIFVVRNIENALHLKKVCFDSQA